jgi:GAF domain-containing protein
VVQFFGVVYLYEAGRLHIAATRNFTAKAASQIYDRQELKEPDRSNAGGRAILDRAMVHIPDVLSDPEYSREFALAGGWRAVLAVPLLHDGNPAGAITVGKTDPAAFSEQQIQLLKTFADQAVIAIGNVRLFDSIGAFASLAPPIGWAVDVVTAALLFVVLGWQFCRGSS